ncbi:IMP-specific 5-nucleotidase, partial [Baffinella frigidus]
QTRAVGCFPSRAEDRIEYEVLEDIALTVQDRLMTLEEGPPTVPFCAFNGNRDVWVDLGSKKFGIEALQQYLGVEAIRTCHMGDRFTSTGNDLRSRDV